MSDKPEALQLADALDGRSGPLLPITQAAAELRRLHELHVLYQDKVQRLHAEVEALRADAERWRTYRTAGGDLTLRLHNLRSDQRDAAIDAARSEK